MMFKFVSFTLIAAAAALLPLAAAQAQDYQPYPQNYDQSNCREFTQTVTMNGRPTAAYGTSCLQPDGSWQIVSSNLNPQANQPINQGVSYQTYTTTQVVQPAPVYAAAPTYAYPAYGYEEPAYYQPAYYGGGAPYLGLGLSFGGHGGGGGWHHR